MQSYLPKKWDHLYGKISLASLVPGGVADQGLELGPPPEPRSHFQVEEGVDPDVPHQRADVNVGSQNSPSIHRPSS